MFRKVRSSQKSALALLSSLSLVAAGFIAMTVPASSTLPEFSTLASQHTNVFDYNQTANQAASASLFTKNADTVRRIPYVEFTYAENTFAADGVAEVSMFVSSQNIGTESPVANGTYSGDNTNQVAFYVDVYGIQDGGATADFATLNYSNTNNVNTVFPTHRSASTPGAAAVSLGTMNVPVSNSITPGTRVTLSTSALRDFLLADSDRKVYLFFIRRDTNPSANLVFHSTTSSTCHGPQLRNYVADVNSATYEINYEPNGSGTTGVPANATLSHFTCGAATVGAAPERAGHTFVEWNTQSNGQGVSYQPGTRLLQPADITLHAIWSALPAPNATPAPTVLSAIDVTPTRITVDREIITILGANLNSVTEVYIGGIKVPIFSQSGNRLQFRAPLGLSGLVDLELKSSLNDVLMTKKLNFGAVSASSAEKKTLVLRGFAPNSSKLTAVMKRKVDRWLTINSDLGTLSCSGFASLPRVTGDIRVATKRGEAVCNFAKRQGLVAETKVSKGVLDSRAGSEIRRVRLVLTR
jgi:hypothetical protein